MYRTLVVVVVVAALVLAVPTAAVTGSEDDEAGVITMEPHSGPNGKYASIKGEGEIEVSFHDLNADAVTTAHNVFNITNNASTTMEVWVEVPEIKAYLGDDSGRPIDTEANAVDLAPGETVAIGFEIETGDTAPDTDSLTVHAENVTASSDGSGGESDDATTAEPRFETSVRISNGSSPAERIIAVTVTNEGNGSGTFTAAPTVDGTSIGTQTVMVLPGETRQLTFTHRFDVSGPHRVAVAGTELRVTVAEVGADIVVTDLSSAKGPVTTGTPTPVVATVENRGGAEGNYTAVLLDDGVVVAERTVTVPAGERRTVRFTRTFEEPGEHVLGVGDRQTTVTVEAAGDLRIVGADVADHRVTPGNATTVSATVANPGDVAGERTLDLSVGGVVVDSVTVSVPAGETRTVAVGHRFNTPGIYPVAFGGVSAGEVTVGVGTTTADRVLSSSLGVAAGIPLAVGLLLAIWRRRLFAAMLQQ